MPRLQIATVGMSIEPILEGFQHHNADLVVLLHSPETRDEADEISGRVRSFLGRAICETREIDPFDLKSVVAAIVSCRRKYRNWAIDLNVTGGTNIMASAAVVAGFAPGAPASAGRDDFSPGGGRFGGGGATGSI